MKHCNGYDALPKPSYIRTLTYSIKTLEPYHANSVISADIVFRPEGKNVCLWPQIVSLRLPVAFWWLIFHAHTSEMASPI